MHNQSHILILPMCMTSLLLMSQTKSMFLLLLGVITHSALQFADPAQGHGSKGRATSLQFGLSIPRAAAQIFLPWRFGWPPWTRRWAETEDLLKDVEFGSLPCSPILAFCVHKLYVLKAVSRVCHCQQNTTIQESLAWPSQHTL